MSVPDYTAARWAEMAGVDVAVVGDSLAMIAHGHPSTIPATMDMMVMHAQAIRRGAPNTFVLGCMPYQSYNTVDRALVKRLKDREDALFASRHPRSAELMARAKAWVLSAVGTTDAAFEPDRLNVSMDTLDPAKFRAITRWGDLDKVLAGIEAVFPKGATSGARYAAGTVGTQAQPPPR